MSVKLPTGYIPKPKSSNRDPNEIIVDGDVAYIVVYNRTRQPRGFATIDTSDLSILSKYRWCIQGRQGHDYIHAHINGKPTTMQSLLLPKKEGFWIDHKNHNRHDNRKSNLRYLTPSDQMWNKKKLYPGTGVSWSKANQAWRAYIGKTQRGPEHLGHYKTKEEALEARRKAVTLFDARRFARMSQPTFS